MWEANSTLYVPLIAASARLGAGTWCVAVGSGGYRDISSIHFSGGNQAQSNGVYSYKQVQPSGDIWGEKNSAS